MKKKGNNMTEEKDRLEIVAEMINDAAQNEQITVDMFKKLAKIYEVATAQEIEISTQLSEKPEQPPHVIISCDASITENPGGQSAVGFVVQNKTKKPQGFAKKVPATTNNQAEYDAIYEALTTFFSIHNNPQCIVEIRSDSRLIIQQLKGEWKCEDPALQRRRDLILELVNQLPVPITWVWRPRNSTPALAEANYLAQNLINVPNH